MARVFGSAARIALANRIAPRICTSHAMAHRAVVPVRAFAAAAAGGEYVTLEEDKQSLADILAKNSKVIAYYTASWCGPCRSIGPYFSELAASNKDVIFVKIDVDENSATAEEASIKSVPTFKGFVGGQLVKQFSGANRAGLDDLVGALQAKQ